MTALRPTGAPLTVHLHIGTLKSGTSFLQNVLWRHRHRLAEDGILFPGVDRWSEQVQAVRDLLREGRPTRRQIAVGAWDAMAEQMRGWGGARAILSMELLSLAKPDRVERVVSSFPGTDLHAVITARDLARVVPSSWQESMQNRQTWTFEEFVEGITDPDQDSTRPGHRFWRQQDIPAIARAWADLIGADHVHVVVVPRAGAPREELWHRFAPAVGIDPGRYEVPTSARGNPALGVASAEFLRRVNVRLAKTVDIETYERTIKHHLGKQTLAQRDDEERLRLPAQHRAWAADRAAEIIDGVRSLGVNVHGDLEELRPEPDTTHDSAVKIDESEVARAGVEAVEALVRALADVSALGEPTRLSASSAEDQDDAVAPTSDRRRRGSERDRRQRRARRRAAAGGDEQRKRGAPP